MPPDIEFACIATCTGLALEQDADFSCPDSDDGSSCELGNEDNPYFYINPDNKKRSTFCFFDPTGSTSACEAKAVQLSTRYFLCNSHTFDFLDTVSTSVCPPLLHCLPLLLRVRLAFARVRLSVRVMPK